MSEWIKCEERLPEVRLSVVVFGVLDGEIQPATHEAFLSGSKLVRWKSVRSDPTTGDWTDLRHVTHWQPLPQAPNE